MKTRVLGWGVVLVIGCVLGGLLARTRLREGSGGLLPTRTARLAIQTTPELTFNVLVSKTADGAARTFLGSVPMELEEGDYFVDVVPESMAYQRKRLKVHLSADQMLALPVVLTAVAPPRQVEVDEEPVGDSLAPLTPVPDPELSPISNRPPDEFSQGVVRGRVADVAPDVASKDVDREALSRYVRSRKAAILGCYEKELRRNATLKGRIVVIFTITRLGRASEIGIEEDTVGNEAVGSCIKSIIRGWVFPFKPEQDVPVAYPFIFSAAK